MRPPNKFNNEAQFRKRQTTQIAQLQERSISLQETLIKVTGQSIAPPNSDFSDIAPIELHREPGATTTILAFSGLATAFGMPPREFFRSLSRYKCNILFVKDFRQCWYLRGLLTLSTDLESTFEVLKQAIPEGTTSIRTVGASAGAYAAIQFGLRLNADRVLAFAPQTKLQPSVFAKFAAPDTKRKDIDFKSSDADLLNVFARYPDFDGQVDIHYGNRNKTDQDHAQHLAGLPQVTLNDHGNDQHGIAKWLYDNGKLDNILTGFAQ